MSATPQSSSRSFFRRADPFANRPPRRVHGSGNPDAEIILIGEKPGIEEARRGRPFIGLSGQYMDRFLQVAGIDRQDVFCTNLVREFTDWSKPSATEIERDHNDLILELLTVNPRIVGLVGGYAVEHILGRDRADMNRTHGVPVHVDALFGGELPRENGWLCLPILHPANCLHNSDSMPAVLDDFLTLGKLRDGEITVREDDPYKGREDYRIVGLEDVCAHFDTAPSLIAIDTEGSRSRQWSMQYSTSPGTGYVIRSNDTEALECFQRAVECPQSRVVMHNSLYDLGMLKGLNISVREDGFVDSMVLAFLLCTESQGLKGLSYRHCAAEQDEYDDIVRDARLTKATAYLNDVNSREWPKAPPMVIEEGGKSRVYKPKSINFRVKKILDDHAKWIVGEREKEVDPRKRWGEIDDALKAPVVETLGDMQDATLDDIPLDVAVRYSARDSDITLRLVPILEQKIRDMHLEEASRVDHDVIPMIQRMQEIGIQLAPAAFWDEIESECLAQMSSAKYAIYKATGEDVNPASGDQVAALLYGKLKLSPPKYTPSGERGSTNDKCLENLMSQNPVVEHVMSYREADKIRGTYVVPLRQAAVTGDGRVRANFRITRVVSGRLATSDPNLLAIPVRSDLGKKVRYGFVAPEGYVLGDWDLDQIEMRMTAHESCDDNMCKIFNDGKYDIHSMTAAEMFGTSVNNITKKDYRRQAGKIVGFGIVNSITPVGLVDQMILWRATKPNGDRWTEDDCDNMLTEWFRIYPGVKRFQEECVREAEETGMAREVIAGRIRYLPGIWSPVRHVREEAGRQAGSHHISSGAQSLMKRGMKAVWDIIKRMDGVDPILQIHDENLLQVHDDRDTMEAVDALVVSAMETATTLRVPVIAAGGFGLSWAQAKN